MITIEHETLETANQSMEAAMAELKAADDSNRKAAIARYREASGAYRTMLKTRYGAQTVRRAF